MLTREQLCLTQVLRIERVWYRELYQTYRAEWSDGAVSASITHHCICKAPGGPEALSRFKQEDEEKQAVKMKVAEIVCQVAADNDHASSDEGLVQGAENSGRQSRKQLFEDFQRSLRMDKGKGWRQQSQEAGCAIHRRSGSGAAHASGRSST